MSLAFTQCFSQPLDQSSSAPRSFWMAGLLPLLLSMGEVWQGLGQDVFHFLRHKVSLWLEEMPCRRVFFGLS